MPIMEGKVPPELDGRPLKITLRRMFALTTGQYKRAKFAGQILLNGRAARVSECARAGDMLRIELPEKALPEEVSERRQSVREKESVPALCILYEDDYLLIVDKPAPMPSVAGSRQDGVTMEDVICGYLGAAGVYRPVNRLDKGTSGLMAIAKDAVTQQRMQAMLHTDAFEREYLAVCEGVPESASGVIRLPIGKAPGATVRRQVMSEADGGRPCVTHYRVLQTSGGRSLLQLRLETGRTHQIRVHVSAMGFPVCGDFLYGTELPALPGRFALHSFRLRVRHPVTGAWVEVESPLPEALKRLMEDA